MAGLSSKKSWHFILVPERFGDIHGLDYPAEVLAFILVPERFRDIHMAGLSSKKSWYFILVSESFGDIHGLFHPARSPGILFECHIFLTLNPLPEASSTSEAPLPTEIKLFKINNNKISGITETGKNTSKLFKSIYKVEAPKIQSKFTKQKLQHKKS
jgi:hypothetical protein